MTPSDTFFDGEIQEVLLLLSDVSKTVGRYIIVTVRGAGLVVSFRCLVETLSRATFIIISNPCADFLS